MWTRIATIDRLLPAMKERKKTVVLTLLALAAIAVGIEWRARTIGPTPPEATPSGESSSVLISAGVNKDGIPAINEPNFTTVAEADVYLSDSREGISVTVGKTTRFYPYQILVWHEVVNDVIEGQPIVVTYCTLCNSGEVYLRTLENGDVLDFGLSGQVRNANSILYDRQTDSRWTQLLGEAVEGALKGQRLQLIPSDVMTWDTWKRRYPKGQVLSKDTGVVRDYTRNPYAGYEEDRRILFPVDARDSRLHPKEMVYGYIGPDGETAAYPETYVDVDGVIVDEVGGRKITLTKKQDVVRAVGEDASGASVEVLLRPTYWYSWFAFFPETQLYDPIGDAKRAEAATAAAEAEAVADPLSVDEGTSSSLEPSGE